RGVRPLRLRRPHAHAAGPCRPRRSHRAAGHRSPGRDAAGLTADHLARDRHRRRRGEQGSRRARREVAAQRLRGRGHAVRCREAARLMLVPTYKRLPSTLHSARAGVASVYCIAFSLDAALFPHPLVLAAVACAVVAAGVAAGVGRELVARSLKLALPFALLVVVINGLVSQRGATVVFRGGTILGHRFDVTAESLAWGGATAMQICCVFLAFGLFTAVVDPDELLRLMRRVSYRSALTGSLATRLVPVIARDATRMGDAARCRPRPPGRLEVTRAALTGALERSVE